MEKYLFALFDGSELVKKEMMTYENALKEAREKRDSNYPYISLHTMDEGDPEVILEDINLDTGESIDVNTGERGDF